MARSAVHCFLGEEDLALYCMDDHSVSSWYDRDRDVGVCVWAGFHGGTVVWLSEVNDCGRDVGVSAVVGCEGQCTQEGVDELE